MSPLKLAMDGLERERGVYEESRLSISIILNIGREQASESFFSDLSDLSEHMSEEFRALERWGDEDQDEKMMG